MATSEEYVRVLAPLIDRPECELSEIDRQTSESGFTLINYSGEDGNCYHEIIIDGEPSWLVTVIIPFLAGSKELGGSRL